MLLNDLCLRGFRNARLTICSKSGAGETAVQSEKSLCEPGETRGNWTVAALEL